MMRNFVSENRELPEGWMLQQDNATPHTAQVVKDTLQEFNLRLLPWPSKSPDLNPIEHAWDRLGRSVASRGPESLRDLRKYFLEEWVKIPQEYFNTLVLSMGNRIGTVIHAKGKNTRY